MTEQMRRRQYLTMIFTEVPDLSGDNADSKQISDLVNLANESGGMIIVLTNNPIWNQLQRQGLIVKIDMPDEDEMYTIIKDYIDAYRTEIPIEWDDMDIREAASLLAGVTRIEAENVIAALIANKSIKKSDMDEVRSAKNRLFSDISGLEKIDVDDSVKDVGGLEGLQKWLREKKELLTPENGRCFVLKDCVRQGGFCWSAYRAAENPCQQNPLLPTGNCHCIGLISPLCRAAMWDSRNSSSRMRWPQQRMYRHVFYGSTK